MNDDEPAELPRAQIVDREGSYDKAARLVGRPLVGAAFTMWSELLACLLLAVSILAIEVQRIEPMSIIAIVGFGGLAFLLVRRIVRPSEMSVQMKGGPTEYPSTSWAHAACDVLYAAFGVLLLADDEPQPEPRPEVDAAFALGLGFAIVGGALFGLRGLFWRRQRELNGRV